MEAHVWELYQIIQERGPKYCAKKCVDLLDHCEEYILKHVSKDDWKPLRSFEGKNGAKPATFATTVIVNLVLSCLRSLKETVSFEDTDHYSNVPIFQLLMYDEVNAALGQLDEMDRLMIILFYHDGYSAEEIASMMNCSAKELTGTIQSKLADIATHLGTSTDDLMHTLQVTPKKLAALQGNTARQIHKKVENAKNRLKNSLDESDGER